MGLFGSFFSNHSETRESHVNSSLQTRYYKTKKDPLMDYLAGLIKESNRFKLLSVSTERGEISANIKRPKKGLLVLTIVSVRPFRTAVDISVSFDTLLGMDFGQSEKMIQSLYNELDQQFEYVGSGLADKL